MSVRFERVSRRFQQRDALRDVSVDIESGEMVFLTGHSGAGKSTFLRLLMLLDRPSSGQIWVDGQSLEKIKRRAIAGYRRNLGVVFQDHQLLFDRSVFD